MHHPRCGREEKVPIGDSPLVDAAPTFTDEIGALIQPRTGNAIPRDALLHLLAVSRQLASPMGLDALLRLVIEAGCEVLGAERGSVLLYNPEMRELRVCVATGDAAFRLDINTGIAGASARTRVTVNVSDVSTDSRFNAQIDRSTGYRTRSLVSVPLIGLDEELVGVLQLLNSSRGVFNAQDQNIAEVLASHAAVAIQREALLAERFVRVKMERDLESARRIQEGVLPTVLHVPTGYDVACFNRPAEQTGGDIYDVIAMGPDGASPVALLLADASGHGIGPALSVLQVRAMMRMGLRLGAHLHDLVCQIDAQLLDDLATDQFVTAFIGRLDPVRHELVYHAAGQGPLLHLHASNGRAEWRGASTLPLGVLRGAPGPAADRMWLEPGDIVALLTDGFYESVGLDGDLFGEGRVLALLSGAGNRGAQAIVAGLVDAVDRHTGGAPQADDLTAIFLRRHATCEKV